MCGARMTMKYDVIIVGAGPAGSTAAYESASNGLDTLLLEKFSLPRTKPCGGAVMQRALNVIDKRIPSEIIERKIFGLKFVFPDYEEAEFVSKKKIGITVFRSRFDEFLARRAESAGATLLEEAEVVDASVDDECATVKLRDGREFGGSYLIGADGVNSIVSRSLGLRPKRKSPHSVGLGVETNVHVGEESVLEAMKGHPEVLRILPAASRISYGWVFAKKEHLAIGVAGASAHMHPLRPIFNQFHKRMEKYLGIEIPIEKRYTHFLGGRGVLGPNVCKRAVLVGDAAGFVDPLMGEGIAYAMRSAVHAVNTIQECKEKEESSSKHLMKYHDSCKKEFGANFQLAEWFGLRGASFAEWLLKKAEGHEISAKILAGLARGNFGYAHLPLIILRELPSELPMLIEKIVRSRISFQQ